MILVMGGSGSGKSAFAEDMVMELVRRWDANRDGKDQNAAGKDQNAARAVYLATMEVWGPEEEERVKKHRRLRDGKGFLTIECPRNIARVLNDSEVRLPCPNKTYILLECMSNLVANEMFGGAPKEELFRPVSAENETEPAGAWEEELVRRVLSGVSLLDKAAAELVVVTCNVFEEGASYERETLSYMRVLSRINRELLRQSSKAWELVAGIPVLLAPEEAF